MATQVLEVGADGAFDIDDVPVVDSDDEATVVVAASSVAAEDEDASFSPSATFQGARPGRVFRAGPRGLGYYADEKNRPADNAKGRSAAGHTYDKGYKRWEQFDADAYEGAASTEKARLSTTTTTTTTSDTGRGEKAPGDGDDDDEESVIDTSLSMFASIPKEHVASICSVLRLTDAEVDSLSGEQGDTVRSFRNMYKEQRAIKKSGVKAGDEEEEPAPKAAKTPEEKRAEAAARERKPFEQVHAELEKMMAWPSFTDARRQWAAVEASARAEALARAAADREETERRVADALPVGDVAAAKVRTDKASRKVRKTQDKTGAKVAAGKKKDKASNLDSIKKMALASKPFDFD